MTREDIKACCRKISPGYREDSVCDFADNVQTLGFIDTSQGQNGSRGIVFSTNHVMLNLDGALRIIFYRNINCVRIIDSYEDAYADELEIISAGEEFRVSNCSLNKAELKSLLDKLCDGGLRGEGSARITPPPPKPPSTAIAVTVKPEPAKTAAPVESHDKQMNESPKREAQPLTEPQNRVIPPRDVYRSEPRREIPPRNEPHSEPPKPEPLRVDNADDIIFESDTPVIFETVIDRDRGSNPNSLSANNDLNDLSNTEERIKIQNMTAEETMSFLAQSLSEINAPINEPEPPRNIPEPVMNNPAPPAEAPRGGSLKDYSAMSAIPEPPPKTDRLTVEPIWGDIYIKASRNLRELCESSRLSMKQIEDELNDKLLDSTRAFAEITADESKVPKVLIPKITELKAAAQNFDQYFQLGEDIAARAMFFMLYQMLSYADRIVETPETKERLNDFFRRFGPAGITLSMLDMRV